MRHRAFKGVSILTTLVMVGLLLAGCAGPAATPTAGPAPTTTGQRPQTQPTIAPAPATATAAPAGAKGSEGKTLIIGVGGDMTGWDPAESVYALANEIIINTHDTLIDVDKATDEFGNAVRDNNKFIPRLAESWDVSKDGKVYTFRLRKGVKFNNGDPVNAQAIKAAFEHQLKITPSATRLKNIAGITDAKQMTVDDEYTISFHLETPNNLFLKAFTKPNYSIVNARQIEAAGPTQEEQQKWAAVHVTGSGPYTIDKFEPGVQLVLKARPDYWGPQPYFSTVIYRVVPSAENRVLLLRNGDIDIAYDVPLKDYASLTSDPKVKVYATPTVGTLFLYLGTQTKPFDNVLVRQAIAYAIPYDTIIKEVTYGFAKPAKSWFAPGMEGYVPVSLYRHDLDKAKELLAKAGYPNGKGLPPISFGVKQGVPEDEASAVYIQAELAKVGIKVDIRPLSTAAHADLLGKHELPMTFSLWLPYIPDPYYVMFYQFSTGKAAAGCCNYSSYYNEKMDQLAKTLFGESDPAKRIEAAKQAQEILAEDVPQIPVYQPSWNLAVQSNINGYSYYPDALIRFEQLSRSN